MGSPPPPPTLTLQQILAAIRAANDTEKAAFRRELGVAAPSVDFAADKKVLELQQERKKVLMESAQLMNNVVEARKQEGELLKVQLMLEADRLVTNGTLQADMKDTLAEMLKNGEKLDANFDNLGADFEELRKKYHEISLIQNRINDLSDQHKNNIDDIVDSMGGLFGLQNKYSNSFINQLVTTGKLMQQNTAEGEAAKERFAQSFQTMFNMKNIAMNVAAKIFKESMKVLDAFDKASASLAAKTGTVGKFNGVLYDTQRAGNLLGVSMGDAANAIITLNASTSNFAKLSKSTQTNLAISTSQFEKLGVSAQDTADFMENAFKIMNMGASEAMVAQKELAMAGVELGIGADKIVKDFNAASKTLAVYGKDSIRIFKDLAAQAKAAGVEVSTLMGMVEQYDTFSGAAEGAAKFNALLGTQLSTTQMLMMTEEERTKTLIESVQAQGIAFGDMDKFTQKAIAAAAGITDMNEANRIFSMSLADYEANAREMEKNAQAQAKFDEAVQATVPTFEKFQNLATEMIIMIQPALETLGEFADMLTDFFQGLSKETKETVATLALFVSGVLVLAPLLSAGSGLIAGLAAVGPAIAGIGAGLASALGAISAVAATGVGALVLGALAATGVGLAAAMASVASSKAKIAEANAEIVNEGSQTIKSLESIATADFSGIATQFRTFIADLNSVTTDVKTTATLQNLSMISSGVAFDITGAKITSSSPNIINKINNVFDGAKMLLEIDGEQIEGVIKTLAAETVTNRR